MPQQPSLRSGQWSSQADNLKAKVSTLVAKNIGPDAKAFKYMPRAEIKIHSTSDRIGNELNVDCFCLDILLLLIA